MIPLSQPAIKANADWDSALAVKSPTLLLCAKFRMNHVCVTPQIDHETLFKILPDAASSKKELPGTSSVHNCNPDPNVVKHSPTAFHVFGCESNDRAYLWMKPSFPTSAIPSFSTHWIATAPAVLAAVVETPSDSNIA
jgi:hypothetical protein